MTQPTQDAGFVEGVKRFHRSFPTGVTLVTTSVNGTPHGLAVNAFSSVSLEPSMAMVCVKATASTHPHLYSQDHFAVNILANDQTELAGHFARSGGEKFTSVDWSSGRNTAPVITGVSAHMELSVVSRIPAGTHTIFIGKVTHAEASGRPPLIYMGSKFYDSALLTTTES